MAITSARSAGAARLADEPGHAAQAANATATANSRPPILRTITASLAISRTPPALQASRRSPGGTSGASAQTASTQSRRPAGTSRTAPHRTAAPTRLSLLTGAPPAPPPDFGH